MLEDHEEVEEDSGDEVDSQAAYKAFFAAVGAKRADLEVVILDVDEGSSLGALGNQGPPFYRHHRGDLLQPR